MGIGIVRDTGDPESTDDDQRGGQTGDYYRRYRELLLLISEERVDREQRGNQRK